MIMYYYYSRISSIYQSASRQIENFKIHSEFSPENLFVDKIQGNVKFMERPEAIKLFDTITSVDGKKIIVVDSVDRLGRNLIDILSTIELFTKNGICLKSLKEGFETLLEDGRENPMAKMVCTVMGSIAEMERNRIKERMTEGVKIAKAKGKYTGRKIGSTQTDSKLLERHALIVKKIKKGMVVRDIAEALNCSTTTIIKVKKVLEKQRA